jgi:site-specific recombinase XerD
MANPTPLEAPPTPLEAIPKAKAGATVKEVVDAFLSDAKARVKANTYANYDDLLTAFSEKHGKAKAEGFTIAQALAFINRDGWSQAYRRTHLGAMKTAFKWAEEVGIIGKNPLKAMKRPSMPSRERRRQSRLTPTNVFWKPLRPPSASS